MAIRIDMWIETLPTRGCEFSLVGLDQSEYIPRYIDLVLPTVAVEIAHILTVSSLLMLNYLEVQLTASFHLITLLWPLIKGFALLWCPRQDEVLKLCASVTQESKEVKLSP
jgi:hypothetical protein